MQPATLPLIVVAGPTAVGKSALVYRLIDTIGHECFEIINGDAIQHYRGVDIGSAKPSRMVQQRYRHHLIDVLEPDQRYSVVEFVRRVWAAAAAIVARGRIPILCGGSMYFIFHVCHGLPQTPPSNASLREQLSERLRVEGGRALHRELEEVDPVKARKISPNDTFRVIRNLEIFYVSGVPPSRFLRSVREKCYFYCAYILLDMDRVSLRERVIARVQEMWERGLASEVATLVLRGYGADTPALRAIGYRQFFDEHGKLRLAEMQKGWGNECMGELGNAALLHDRDAAVHMPNTTARTPDTAARTMSNSDARPSTSTAARTPNATARTPNSAAREIAAERMHHSAGIYKRSATYMHNVAAAYAYSRACYSTCNGTKCHTRGCMCTSSDMPSRNALYVRGAEHTTVSAVRMQITQDIIRATMRYIKHQRTFMRQLPAVRYYTPDEYVAIMRYVRAHMNSHLTRQALR